MDKRNTFYQEVQEFLKDLSIDVTAANKEILEFIGSDQIIDYYFSRGPFPDFPETLADIVLLTDRCLYDYEIKQKGSLWHVIFLRMVKGIYETFDKIGEQDFIAVHFHYAALASMILQDRIENKQKARRFLSSVKNKIM